MICRMKRVVVVTGGSRGIGAATARLAGGRGYAVCVNYRSDRAAADGVVGAIEDTGLDGIIVTNTTTRRPGGVGDDEAGGLSGGPVRDVALGVLERVRSLTALPIIASGGIMNADDARHRLDAGAALVQLYTGFVYRGPRLVRDIAALR